MSMKTAVPLSPALARTTTSAWGGVVGKLGAFVELTKPRINLMVLLTVALGFMLGSRGISQPGVFVLTLVGTGLVAGGASAWNQVIERFRDAKMRRTRTRPIPSRRVSVIEAALFGSALGIGGVGLLAMGPHGEAAYVALATFLLYVVVYTPLKVVTPLNTLVGAIPGALPPVIGWAAATGQLGVQPWVLFLIVFLWQFPHFFAIAWLYRDDYAVGGIKMLPGCDPEGAMTSRQTVVYALALLPAGLLPTLVGLAGPIYLAGALIVGLHYLIAAIRFWANVTDGSARRLMFASFLYLPMILVLLLVNPRP